MRLLWFIGLTAGLLSACATTQPASDTANATIAKQVALADEAYELGRYGTASSRYRQALLYARSEDDAQLIAPLLHNLGTSLQQSHLCEDAQVAFQEAFDLYQSIGDDTGSLMSLLGRATCEHALRAPKAKETLEDVLKRARSLGNTAVAARAASGLAAIALAQSLDEGEAYVIQAIALAQKSKSNSALGVAYFNEGRLLERNADDDRALKAFKRAAQAYRAIDDHAGLASALSRQAALSVRLGSAPLLTANLYQRAAHAAASARQMKQAIRGFKSAAKFFVDAGRLEQAELCRDRAATIDASLR